MDPQQAAQLLKGAPSPTGQMAKWKQFLQKMMPGAADSLNNMVDDPKGTIKRNVNRAIPTQEEMSNMIKSHGNMPESMKTKMMTIILKSK